MAMRSNEVKLVENRESNTVFEARQQKKWIANNGDEAKILSRCQQKKNMKKRKNLSNNTTEDMDIDYPQVMGIQFKEEIFMEILSKLPVQSVLRFKCVLKSWKTLISDPYFKMMHLNHAKNDKNSQKLLINKRLCKVDRIFNLYCSSLSSVQVVEDEQKIDWPSNCKPVNTQLYCCCDGLVLVAVFKGLDRQLLLWNPSTRESIVLPHPTTRPRFCVCGLGYDATSDDYKILAVDLNNRCQEISVEILALKSGSWKEICKYPAGIHRAMGYKDCGMSSLAFVHGAFHWVGLSSPCYTIVSFNISNEVYGEIPLLKQMFNIVEAKYVEHGVSVLGGMLCFYSTYYNRIDGTFKLWVMKDYGVKESWTEWLTIHGGSNIFYSAKPIYMYADGEVLLLCNYPQVRGTVYMTSREPFELLPQCPPTCKQGIVYSESLISPKSLI